MTRPVYDVAIIGGGIVGAACGAEAARQGLKVIIIECSFAGGGATAAGMGHIVVMDDSEAQFDLTCYSQELWQKLAPVLPNQVEYDQCGTIWVAADEEEMGEVTRKHRFYSDRGVEAEILDAPMLKALEPNLRDGLAGGLLMPADAVIYPPAAARFLIEQARDNGASISFGRSVTNLSESGPVLNDGSLIGARITVNATGSWAPELTPGINVQKRKGHLVITDRYPGFVRHQLVELGYLKSAHSLTSDSVAFNAQPRRTGQVLIGSSRQYGVDDSRVEAAMLARMLARAEKYLPGLSNLSAIRAWTGFRAATPDKLPLIGPCPGCDWLYLATGHEGLGITTSLATAKLLVDQLTGRTSKIPAAPYLPARTFREAVHA
ncbi:MAG TPA: FAD-dependent oxidoreductase [Blastocatellia bacterium]|nr:FAD-dependent oxidoreductase [Blastocatellia bacterium]